MPEDDLLSIGSQPAQVSNTDALSTSGLQFQRAVPVGGTSGVTCQICRNGIDSEYFRARGQVVCPACTDKIRAAGKAPSLRSMPFAILYGVGSALAGAALYSVVTIVTGYQLALVSIVVGVMVGKAVRHGSQGLGGRPQQIFAIVLTYFAITTSYVSIGIYHLVHDPKVSTANAAPAAETNSASNPSSPVASDSKKPPISLAAAVIALGLLLVAAPFLTLTAGLSGLLNILILFFGLKQAWKLTERTEIQVTGPYKPTPAT